MDLSAKLTEKQIALVDTLVASGCSIKDASQTAGYAEGESGRVTATTRATVHDATSSR